MFDNHSPMHHAWFTLGNHEATNDYYPVIFTTESHEHGMETSHEITMKIHHFIPISHEHPMNIPPKYHRFIVMLKAYSRVN